jgi:hypothetical protein
MERKKMTRTLTLALALGAAVLAPVGASAKSLGAGASNGGKLNQSRPNVDVRKRVTPQPTPPR